tara:strand:- start:340 stop:546 length:207 start_codon:yes stop_codon:yes gene_type:complete
VKKKYPINLKKHMQIQLWYCNEMHQWRWSMTDQDNLAYQATGQQPSVREAMLDVAKTVEHTNYLKFPE